MVERKSSAREVRLLKCVDRPLPLIVGFGSMASLWRFTSSLRFTPDRGEIADLSAHRFRANSASCTIGEIYRAIPLCGARNSAVNFAAQCGEIDRLGQQRLGAVLERIALGLGIAISGDHDDRHIRPHGFRLRE